jgi:hypothetical protein
MSKVFKVVCIDGMDVDLTAGSVYDVALTADPSTLVVSKDDKRDVCFRYNANRFLLLPTEPKTCADMTMEEYLAMCCLRSTGCEAVQYRSCRSGWVECCSKHMSQKGETRSVYRIKPGKSAKDVEIERIEGAMRKLADDLAKIKGK